MTNYEALYNQAMAHNAMLREAAEFAYLKLDNYAYEKDCDEKQRMVHEAHTRINKALNATGPDVTAWMINFQNKSIDTTIKLYESEMQQLATVTAERDALRKELNKYGGDAMYRNGVCFVKKVD